MDFNFHGIKYNGPLTSYAYEMLNNLKVQLPEKTTAVQESWNMADLFVRNTNAKLTDNNKES